MRGPLLLIILVGLTPLTIFAVVVAASGLSIVQWQPPALWTNRFGAPNAANGLEAMSADSTGIYTTGYENAALQSSFVSRYDLNGHLVWTVQHPFSGDYFSAIAVGSDGVYLAGQINYTGFVGNYDFNGSKIWNRPFDSIDGQLADASGISVGASGVYVVGRSALSGYDFNGNLVWSDRLGNYTGGVNVYAGPGGVYTAGSLCCNSEYLGGIVKKYDINGTLAWTRKLYDPPVSICACDAYQLTSDGSGVVVSASGNNPGNVNDGFIRKYDPVGNELWTAQFASPDHTSMGKVSVSANPSGIFLTFITGTGHAFAMRYDKSGNSQWSFQILGQSSHPNSLAIAVGQDEFYVGGVLSTNTGSDAYLAGFSQSSSLILFGVNPPSSFVILGGLIGGSAASIILFWRHKLGRSRSNRSRGIPASSHKTD